MMSEAEASLRSTKASEKLATECGQLPWQDRNIKWKSTGEHVIPMSTVPLFTTLSLHRRRRSLRRLLFWLSAFFLGLNTCVGSKAEHNESMTKTFA